MNENMKTLFCNLLLLSCVFAAPTEFRNEFHAPGGGIGISRGIEVGSHGPERFDSLIVFREESEPIVKPHHEYGVPVEYRIETTEAPVIDVRLPEVVTPCPDHHEEPVVPFVEAPPAPNILPLPTLPEPPRIRYDEPFLVQVFDEPIEAVHSEYGIPETTTTTTEAPFVEVPIGPKAFPLPIPEVPVVREVPHEEYGVPETTTVYVAPYPPRETTTEFVPFVEAPQPPQVFALPVPEVPVVRTVPHEEYGVPETTTVYVAPYPPKVVETTTEYVPFVEAPQPPQVFELPVVKYIPEVTTTQAPTTTVYYAPYPAKVETVPEVVTTTTTVAPETTTQFIAPYPEKVVVKSGKYPARVESHYGEGSGVREEFLKVL